MFNYDKPLDFVLDIKDDKRCSNLLKSYVGNYNATQYEQFYENWL